jgi:hypothetical protein
MCLNCKNKCKMGKLKEKPKKPEEVQTLDDGEDRPKEKPPTQ